MERDRFLEGIYRALWERLHAERGAIARTEQMLGKCRGSLWMTRKRDGFRLSTLGEILSFLGVSPEWFFRRAFPHPPDPLAHFFGAAEMLQNQLREPPSLIEVRDRFLSTDSDFEVATEETESAETERLEQLRMSDAAGAEEQARALATTTDSAAIAAQALGVWASAIRTDVQKLDQALLLLEVAFRLARKCGDRAGLARLLLRGCSVLSDRGEPDEGLVLADYALVLSSVVGDDGGVGKAHVVRARMLAYVEQYEEATFACRAALRNLPEEDCLGRAATLQYLGFCYRLLGDFRMAQQYLSLASDKLPPRFGVARGQLLWVQAQVAAECQDWQLAIECFDLAFEALEEHPLDAALVSAEHVRVLIQMGKVDEARSRATISRGLLFQIRGSRLAEAALADLIRAAEEVGALKMSLVEAAIRGLRAGRDSSEEIQPRLI